MLNPNLVKVIYKALSRLLFEYMRNIGSIHAQNLSSSCQGEVKVSKVISYDLMKSNDQLLISGCTVGT